MVQRGRILGVLLALAAAPAAHGAEPFFAADTTETGYVGLFLADVPGTQARFFETTGGQRRPVGRATVGEETAVAVPRALTWTCTRRTRRLLAEVVHPDGSTASAAYAVRTPGCGDRFAIRAPRRARPGSLATVRVSDGWGLDDVRPRLCVRPPGGPAECRRGTRDVVRLGLRGLWRVTLRAPGVREQAIVAVGRPAPDRPRVPDLLVTGDSSAQGVDAALGDRVGDEYDVLRGFRVGTGISHDSPRWPAIAARQARRERPSVTVVSVGANDGFPMRRSDDATVECCDTAWQAEYERRVRAVMTAFAAEGRVLWLTLPAPRDPRRAEIAAVVNAVVARAAQTLDGVELVPLHDVLSPGGEYRRTIVHDGRERVVRADDGIHLSPAGAAIAAELILEAL